VLGIGIAALLASLNLASPPAVAASAPPASKKANYLEAKALVRGKRDGRPTRVGRRGHRPVFARNLRTNEVALLEGPGRLRNDGARHEFFRCWFTLKAGPIPAELVQVLVDAAAHFDTREVRIVSGFRHPKYNLLLRKKGREVARKSQHTQAKAIDFFLPEVKVRKLYDHLLETHPGGVGFYPVSEFVHVDFGRKRTWNGT
jgi:hypothetical protein